MTELEKAENNLIIIARRVSMEIHASDLFHAEWEQAQAAQLARYWSGEEAPAERHAEARIVWSESALGVRFVCEQHEPLVISDAPQTIEKTMALWERDVCEIFVAPDSRKPEHYFEFEVAPTGEWIDLELWWKAEGRETDWRYHSGMTAAGSIEEARVVVAMRVPWEAFGHRPQAGDVWRVNLFRCVGSGASRGYLAWQPTHTPQPNFHVPQSFGLLRFDE